MSVADTSRIVSIGSSVTEILFALGLGDRVIAVDQTSVYPAAARALPNVSYSRTLAPEGVLSVAPSLILAIEGAGPRSTLDVLERASVPVVIIPDAQSPEAVVRKIEAVAAAVGEEAKGRALAEAVRADFAAIEASVSGLKPAPRAVFVLSAANGTAVVGGNETSADAMLRLAGATNTMKGLKGYKPAVDEAAFSADPEVVVVMQGGGQVLTADMLFSLPAFKGTTAAQNQRLLALPGSYLLGFGPRTPQAVRDLAVALHPGITLPALPSRSWSAEPNP
ncbi:heme/hemin ABC transporter substrate-binding protein [Aquabacter cavernae]|uniref:heme/hemin ABC transporter substrate-binding protein n=1 Tax=Aquabacter cavernae TaxID=2496029 RepID=UPI0013E0C25F|nr:ABC transporter substrate-binding protein [Aquabacter cavernae]